jgi:hypothetical protein
MRGQAEPGDAGVTVLELVTAMTIMSVFGSIFTGAVVQMYGSARRTEAAAGVQSQIATTFQRLNAEVRYAKGFSTPGPATGTDRYVEYLVANSGTEYCGELRLRGSTGQLQWRRWTRGGTPGGWAVLASDVSSSAPFSVVPTAAGSRNQTLTLSITSVQNGRSKQLQTTFVALNSVRTEGSATACVEGRSAP